jgi:hypothetical protein
MSIPPRPQPQGEINPIFFRRWIIWDPIPDWLELRPELLNQMFVISLDIEKEHLAIEQKKLDMVRELFAK